MIVFAVDPGSETSALVRYDPVRQRVISCTQAANELLVDWLANSTEDGVLVVEQMESTYGMSVGRETIDTVWWSGRFHQAWKQRAFQCPRSKVRQHLCGATRRVGDPEVRMALLDKWGGKTHAVGKKKTPGPLYEVTGHCWAALGIAVTWSELNLPLKD